MTRIIQNSFEINDGTVFIYREGWPVAVECTYREDYWNELTSHSWSMQKGYPNQSLGGGLHRYMMKKWYGDETFEEFTKKVYVVDHISNEHYCGKWNQLYLSIST